jgi:hypothetical protein
MKTMSKPIVDRVLARYAAAVLDEKMKALLLKLRKGADATLSLGGLFKVLALLGGWKVELMVGLVQQHGYGGDKENDPHLLADPNEGAVKAQYERLQSLAVTTLPSKPEAGREYVMDLEPMKSWELSYLKDGQKMHGAHYRSWIGAQGYRITDPHGKTFELLPWKYDVKRLTDPKKFQKVLHVSDALTWLKKHTSYYAQISELLGMEPHEPSAIRTRDNTGTCAVCFRNIKLVQRGEEQLMALHGYNRPGYGYVVGRCWGGDHQPYELSCTATKRILEAANEKLAGVMTYLKNLSSPDLDKFNEKEWRLGAEPKIVSRNMNTLWDYLLGQHVKETEHEVKKVKSERDLYKWLVEHWELRALPKEGEKHIDWFTIAARASMKES